MIGSGFGGISASLRLKAKGYEVILLEKHPDLGGRARVFKKGNFINAGAYLDSLIQLMDKNSFSSK